MPFADKKMKLERRVKLIYFSYFIGLNAPEKINIWN